MLTWEGQCPRGNRHLTAMPEYRDPAGDLEKLRAGLDDGVYVFTLITADNPPAIATLSGAACLPREQDRDVRHPYLSVTSRDAEQLTDGEAYRRIGRRVITSSPQHNALAMTGTGNINPQPDGYT